MYFVSIYMNYKLLQEAIKRSKLQRKDIALMAKVTPKTIDNVLAGADPRVSTLEALCNAIGFKVSNLFDDAIEIHYAGRDLIENGKIEHKGPEYNGCSSSEADLREQIAQLKSQLADKERIIRLLGGDSVS